MTSKGIADPTARDELLALIKEHRRLGTRPAGSARTGHWMDAEFAGAIAKGIRQVGNLLNGTTLIRDISPFVRAFFGDDPNHAKARALFEDVFRRMWGKAAMPTTPFATMPRPPAHFLGREADVAAVLAVLLASDETVAIQVQGGPGIGKTSLTTAVAHEAEVVRRFGDRRWFVALETVTSDDALRDAVIRALGGDPAAGLAAALARVAGGQALLILDNLETPWDPVEQRGKVEATLAELAAPPGLALLASFRGHERVGGVAWALVHPVDELTDRAATELFDRIAGWPASADSRFPEFLKALGGVPLAIELVAHRAYGRRDLADLWREWERIGSDLASHPDYAGGRLTSLPRSIELSLGSNRMSAGALRLFQLLGRLPAGLASEDKVALLGVEAFDADSVLRRLGLGIARRDRIDLLPPVREHALRHHAPSDEDDLAWVDHYLELTRRLGEGIGKAVGAGVVARLGPELPNIEAAIRGAIQQKRRTATMGALQGFGRLTYMASKPTSLFAELAGACRVEDDLRGEAACLECEADIAFVRSDHAGAKAGYLKALAMHCQVGSLHGEARCTRGLANIAMARSDHRSAEEGYEKAQQIYHSVGDVGGEAYCIKGRANIALARSNYTDAEDLIRQARPLFNQTGDLLGEANCIYSLGDIALRRSDFESASANFDEGLQLFRRIEDLLGQANCIKGQADVALVLSKHRKAMRAYRVALEMYRGLSATLGEANCIKGLADIALARFRYDVAQCAYEQRALPLFLMVGDVFGEGHCILGMGEVAMARSDHNGARKYFKVARRRYSEVGSIHGEARCLVGLGYVALALSEGERAGVYFSTALTLYRQVGSFQGEGACLQGLRVLQEAAIS